MVGIAKNFNDDMQDYLDKLYGKKKVQPRKAKKVESVPDVSEEEIYVEYEEPIFKRMFSALFKRKQYDSDLTPEEEEELEEMEDEIEAVADEIDGLEDRREGLVTRFLSRMRQARAPEEYVDAPVVDEDVKEMLKVLHKWLEKLPANHLKEFKTSDDFENYKVILEKYELIKK